MPKRVIYSHSFLFVLAVNRITGRACARPGLVPRRDTTRRGNADHLGTDAPRKPRRTPNTTPHSTARTLEPYYYYKYHYYYLNRFIYIDILFPS